MNTEHHYDGIIAETTGESITARDARRGSREKWTIKPGSHQYQAGDRVTVKKETTRAGELIQVELSGEKGTYMQGTAAAEIREAIPAAAATIRAHAAALLGPNYTQRELSALIDAAGDGDAYTAELFHSADIARHTDTSAAAVITYHRGELMIFFFTT